MKEADELVYLQSQNQLSILKNYFYWPLRFVENRIGDNVWDSSAGIGLFSAKILERCKKLLLTEYSQTNLTQLKDKFGSIENCKVRYCDLTNIDIDQYKKEHIDTIINLDVLEHIEDDQKVLRDFHAILMDKGTILIKVPALKRLYCDIDKATFHYRRYSKKELSKKLEVAGFKIVRIQYINMFGAVSYFLKGKILHKRSTFSTTFTPKNLSMINKIIPVLIKFEMIFRPVFGLSIVAVAEKQ